MRPCVRACVYDLDAHVCVHLVLPRAHLHVRWLRLVLSWRVLLLRVLRLVLLLLRWIRVLLWRNLRRRRLPLQLGVRVLLLLLLCQQIL